MNYNQYIKRHLINIIVNCFGTPGKINYMSMPEFENKEDQQAFKESINLLNMLMAGNQQARIKILLILNS